LSWLVYTMAFLLQQLKGAFDGVVNANHSLAQCSDLAKKVIPRAEVRNTFPCYMQDSNNVQSF